MLVNFLFMNKILVIKGHPKEEGFCNSLVREYIQGAEQFGCEVKVLELKKLDLEKFLKYEHRENPVLSDDLLGAQDLIVWADHLVFAYPVWWSVAPALLKVFIEAVFLPGFAYKYQKSKGMIPRWDKLLAGKSAELIVAMDSPSWYYRYFLGDPGGKMMKASLNFCGIKLIGRHYFGSVKMSSEERKGKWLKRVYKIGLGR